MEILSLRPGAHESGYILNRTDFDTIYCDPEHPHTEPKYIRYGRIGPRPLLPDDHDSRQPSLTKEERGGSIEKIGNLLPKLRAQAPTEGKEEHQTVCHTN